MDELEDDVKVALEPYLELIESLTAGMSSAAEFESAFVGTYLNDPTMWPDEVFRLLDELFATADGYVADPVARSEVIGGISGEELIRCAIEVHSGLKTLLAAGDVAGQGRTRPCSANKPLAK
ncbi:MAG: hypothetical protein DLM58_13855 [Pseudonocardiales bacterium]|nr:MAG: hypothetical protein DLM58_13855 [Pseudonocardiales bacterium]